MHNLTKTFTYRREINPCFDWNMHTWIFLRERIWKLFSLGWKLIISLIFFNKIQFMKKFGNVNEFWEKLNHASSFQLISIYRDLKINFILISYGKIHVGGSNNALQALFYNWQVRKWFHVQKLKIIISKMLCKHHTVMEFLHIPFSSCEIGHEYSSIHQTLSMLMHMFKEWSFFKSTEIC